jgi:hypothetical protein
MMTDEQPDSLSDLAVLINLAHEAQEAAKASSVENAIEAGKLLLDAKAECKLRREKWMPWVKANCKFAGRTARLYMKVAKDPPDLATVANLTLKGTPRKDGRQKKGASNKNGAAIDLDAAWETASMEQKAGFIKRHQHMIKKLVERVESADEVAKQRGEEAPRSYV